jgi:hypothetical protein
VARFGEIAAALGCAVLVACSFPADYSGTRYQCGPAGECPDGFSCTAGYCEAEEPPASDAGDGARTDAGGGPDDTRADAGDTGPGACASASAFQEDFSTDGEWSIANQAGCAITFVSDQVQMTATLSRCTARTAGTYELDGRVFVQAVKPESGLIKAGFGISYGEVSLVALRVVGGIDLVELPAEGGGQMLVDSFPFDPQLDRFWGFRPDQVSGQIHWETSADGIEWSDHGAYPQSALPADSCVGLEFDAVGTGNAAPFAAFDNLNLPEDPGGPAGSARSRRSPR